MRLRITRQPSGSIDGIHLGAFVVGFTYDVGTSLACYLLADGLAEPADDASPLLVSQSGKNLRFPLPTDRAAGEIVRMMRRPPGRRALPGRKRR